MTDLALIETVQGHSGPLRCLTKLSEYRVASGSDDITIKLWDLSWIENKKCQIKEIHTLKGHSNSIRSLVYLELNN
jgi:WD40 repeat protein